MKKKIIIIIVILVVLITIGIFGYLGISKYNKDKKKMNDDMNIILNSYKGLEENVTDYNKYRNDYQELVKDIYLDSFKEKNDSYVELLTKYRDVMKKIDGNISNIKEKCNRLYPTSEVNKICDNYEKTYEKLVSLFVSDVNKYNEKVNEYNEYKKDNISLFTIDYVDYNNQDGVEDGRDSSNEEK